MSAVSREMTGEGYAFFLGGHTRGASGRRLAPWTGLGDNRVPGLATA